MAFRIGRRLNRRGRMFLFCSGFVFRAPCDLRGPACLRLGFGRRGGGLALCTTCAAGGLGAAVVLESPG